MRSNTKASGKRHFSWAGGGGLGGGGEAIAPRLHKQHGVGLYFTYAKSPGKQ